MEGYYALNWVFLANVLLLLFIWFGIGMVAVSGAEPAVAYLGGLLVLATSIAILSYSHNLKIATAKGWGKSAAIGASVGMGLTAWLCCGAIGCSVMQNIALSELKRYGIRGGFLGIKRQAVEAKIAEMQAADQARRMTGGPPA
jgi:hypothetical protein